MDAGTIIFLSILGAILLIIVDYVIANRFYQIAKEKGFYDRAYFWYSFLFGLVGFLMVIALPDHKTKAEPQIKPDELPEL